MAILECKELSKRFGKIQALDNVNIKVEPGRVVGLLGPNGSGKTTLIKLANGLLTPTGGEILIDGKKPGPETKSIVSYLPDRQYLPEWMSVKQMMDLFLSFVKQNKVKLRIMFQESGHSYDPLHQDQIVNRYHLLYYQFIKHAFGLRSHDGPAGETVYLKLYFDKMPVSIQESDAFKAHIAYLQNLWQFRKARIVIRPDDIAEIDSHKHCIQQCMDIVLGSIAFRLNNKHLVIPPGATEPGHKTRAKETLFNHILDLIKDADGIEDFDISKTTLPDRARDRWIIPYRHWKFLAAEFKMKNEG